MEKLLNVPLVTLDRLQLDAQKMTLYGRGDLEAEEVLYMSLASLPVMKKFGEMVRNDDIPIDRPD